MKIVHANFVEDVDNNGNPILRGKSTFVGFAGNNKLKNSKDTEYRLGNLMFIGADEQTYQTSGAIYDKTLKENNFSEGDVVSVVVREYNGKNYFSILGITGAGLLSADSGAFGVKAVAKAEEIEADA